VFDAETCVFSNLNHTYSHHRQARREGGVGGKLPRAPQRLRGPAVAQKYKNTLEWIILKK